METETSRVQKLLNFQEHEIVYLKGRVAELEAALLKIWKLYPFKEEEGNVGLQDMVKRFIEVGDVAHTALREKKDD